MVGLGAAELNRFIAERSEGLGVSFHVDSLGPDHATVRLRVDTRHLRPGNTVSGPSLMHLCDAAMYFAVMGRLGPVWDAVTSNLNINFLRRPEPVDVIAKVELLRVGRKLATGDVRLYSEGTEQMVAQATVTYALPKG